MKIFLKVKEELENMGKTQDWLSERTGIPQPHISQFLNGKRSFKLDKLEKVAAAFEKEWDMVSPNAKKGLADLINE